MQLSTTSLNSYTGLGHVRAGDAYSARRRGGPNPSLSKKRATSENGKQRGHKCVNISLDLLAKWFDGKGLYDDGFSWGSEAGARRYARRKLYSLDTARVLTKYSVMALERKNGQMHVGLRSTEIPL